MATGSTKKRTEVVAYDDYIDTQLKKVRTNLKLTDISGRVMGLTALVVFFLLAVVIVDHWIVDLGVWGRLGSLVALLGGIAFYFVRFLMPEIARKINPAYAAQLVEREEPSLKTSLINFVMLRPKKQQIRKVVFDEVEQQAARRLSEVNVDLSIDQTPLIRIALCLLAALVLFALYTIFSPKSSFQTIGRVLSPFSNVTRPARVQIRDVTPGDVQVFAGDTVEVSATIEDVEQGQAMLVYTTADGQVVDQQIEMTTDEIGLQFHAKLPEGNGGIEQDLNYEIRAGDAVAGPWRIRVSQAPSIFIEDVSLDYPDYTGIETKVIESQGDIEGIEGTKVTITARANQEIRHARIEFDPAQSSGEEATPNAGKRLTMKHDGNVATVTFPLLLNEDRRTPKYTSYQLRFTSTGGQINERPIVYPISVTPDLPPLVEILLPEALRIAVPENAKQRIEIRAVDPDYGISQLNFQAKRGSKAIVNESILDEAGLGQKIGRYEFSPTDLELKAGDVVLYRGEARDNRTDPVNGSAAPNIVHTDWYAIVVSPPMEDGDEPGQEGQSRDDGEGAGGDQGDAGEDGEGGEGEGGVGEQGHDGEGGEGDEGEGTEGSGSEEGESGEGDGGADGQQGTEGEGGDQNQSGDESESSQGDGGSEGSSTGEGNDSDEMGDQPGEGDPNSDGESGESDPNGDPGETNGDSESGQSNGNSPNEQEGDAGSGQEGEAEAAGDQNDTQPSGDAQSDGSGSTENPDSDSPGQSGEPAEDADSEPVAGDGTEDSEAFDRILDEMKKENGEQTDGTPKPSEDTDGDAGDEGESGTGESGEGESSEGGETGEGETGEGEEGAGESGESSEGEGEGESGETGESGTGDQGESESGESGAGEQGEGEAGEGEPTEGEPSDGEGEAGESGDGQNDGSEGDPGDGEMSDGETGEGETGEGETGETGEEGQAASDEGQEGSDPASGEQSSSGKGESEQGQPGDQPGEQSRESAEPSDGGTPSDGAGAGEETQQAPVEEKEDKANLDYTRKATNLALDHLRDKENRRKMQEKLGWTTEQMNQFIRRWHSLRKNAAAKGNKPNANASQSELNEALRSLGLTPGRDRIRKSGSRTDKNNRVRDAGTRSRPPKEYEDQYKAYLRSVGNAPPQK